MTCNLVHLIQFAEKHRAGANTHVANYQCSSDSVEYISVFGC